MKRNLILLVFIIFNISSAKENYEYFYKKYIPPQKCNIKSLECYEKCLKLKNQEEIYKCQIKCNKEYLKCIEEKSI